MCTAAAAAGCGQVVALHSTLHTTLSWGASSSSWLGTWLTKLVRMHQFIWVLVLCCLLFKGALGTNTLIEILM